MARGQGHIRTASARSTTDAGGTAPAGVQVGERGELRFKLEGVDYRLLFRQVLRRRTGEAG